jgi:hypothetical protein
MSRREDAMKTDSTGNARVCETLDDVTTLLDNYHPGTTGAAWVEKGGSLYARREENADYRYLGDVSALDINDVAAVISEQFE